MNKLCKLYIDTFKIIRSYAIDRYEYNKTMAVAE